jgi:hypothetical protein
MNSYNPNNLDPYYIRKELYYRFLFCKLCTCLNADSFRQNRDSIEKVGKSIIESSNREIIILASEYYLNLEKQIALCYDALQPKKIWREIALEFQEAKEQNPDIWIYGIEYGWIEARFDLSKFYPHTEIPYHAKIGLGYHGGGWEIEERFLLEDSFFVLLKAKTEFDEFIRLTELEKENNPDPNFQNSNIGIHNANVATYSRLTVISFYSFLECFVNSVGEDLTC